MTPRPDTLAAMKALMTEGELLAAVDFARSPAAHRAAPAELQAIRIEEVIALARMASLEEARERYDAYGLAAEGGLARSLRARLLKDLGFAAPDGAERGRLLRESRDLYLAMAAEAGPEAERVLFEYNAVNALTLSRLLGDLAPAAEVARRLGETAPAETYWSHATRAEYLIAVDAPEEDVSAALARAAASPGAGLGARASTLRQLTRIAPDHPALALLRPGPALHHAGHMIAARGARAGRVLWRNEAALTARIHAALERIGPSSVHGSLASGSDVIVTEWALAHGFETWIHLPFAVADFLDRSVRPAGARWVRRARACLRNPRARVRLLTAGPPVEMCDEDFAAVSRAAMGAAILRAERVFAEAAQVLVWDGHAATGVAGAAADGVVWRQTGRTQHVVDVSDLGAPDAGGGEEARADNPAHPARVARAVVFGDVKNFSKLREAQLPRFVELVLGAAHRAAEEAGVRRGRAVFLNTWGDGVFTVWENAGAAADFALTLQRMIGELDLEGAGLPPDLAIRLGLHAGVMWPLRDPVTGATNFFGEAVARAARIEPITKAGRIFVTEEFAAELALEADGAVKAEYVGEVEAAKGYGRFRLYRLSRAGGAGGRTGA